MSFADEIKGFLEHLMGPAVVDGVDPVVTPDGGESLVAVRAGYRLEKLPGPKASRRVHSFTDVLNFAQWLNRHAGANATLAEIFVSADKIAANLDPTSRFSDQVQCLLSLHPTAAAWREWFGDEISQREFHLLARSHADSLADGGELLGKLQRVQVLTSGDFVKELDATGYARIISGDRTTSSKVELPPMFKVFTPIFDCLETVSQLEVFLSCEVDDTGITFRLDCPGLPLIMLEAQRGAAALLVRELDDGFMVGLGSLRTEEVPEV